MPAEEVFVKESAADGRVTVYRFTSTGSEAAEKWRNEMEGLFSSADGSRRLLLFDVSRSNNQVSAEMLRTLREAASQRQIVPGKTALLVDTHLSTKTVEIMIEHSPFEAAGRHMKMFGSEQEAIHWLLEP
ncbi:MAG TPA: hypothetical protein VHD90_13290 [Phototrophicaceae bacterium]|nr:hypothetical protein [Phototrophicaceae bacterium]